MIPLFESIAQGLSDNGYAISNQFLSQAEVNSILREHDFKSINRSFKKAGIGQQEKQINEFIRGDFIKWIERKTASPATLIYLQRLEDLMKYLNQSLFLSLKDYEVHMTVYPRGSFYKRHLDQFRSDDHRKLSVICYLNENWKEEHGGQLRMYLPDGLHDILPVSGCMVCFRSDQIEHEVLPAVRERRSITGWLLDQYVDLKNLY